MKRLGRASVRSLLSGSVNWDASAVNAKSIRDDVQPAPRIPITQRLRFNQSTRLLIALVLTILGIGLLLAASFQYIGQSAGFFGGGTLLLLALLCFQSVWLRRDTRTPIQGSGLWSILRLGFRNATYRPGRSVLCIALIASATFIIVAVDAFRRDQQSSPLDRKSGSGGFALMAETLVPVVHDPNSAEGRDALNLSGTAGNGLIGGATFVRFRLRPGG